MTIFSCCCSNTPVASDPLNKEIKISSTTIEKVIIVMASFLVAGTLITACVLYFTQVPSVEFTHFIIMGGGVTLSGCIIVVAADRLSEKKWEAKRLCVQPPSVTSHVKKVTTLSFEDEVEEEVLLEITPEVLVEPSPATVIEQITDDPAQQFVMWLMQPVAQLSAYHKTRDDNALCKEISKEAGWLFTEPEFYWLHPVACNPIKTSEEVKQAHLQITAALKKHWGHCAEGYPQEKLKEALERLTLSKAPPFPVCQTPEELFKERMIWMVLAPFFVRFAMVLKEERGAILPWVVDHLTECLDSKLALIEGAVTNSLKEKTPFFLTSFFKFLRPFNYLLTNEEFPRKQFFFEAMHRFLFHGVPDLLEREDHWTVWTYQKEARDAQKLLKNKIPIETKLKKSKQPLARKLLTSLNAWETRVKASEGQLRMLYLLHRTSLSYVFPALSRVTLSQSIDIGSYLNHLSQIESALATLNTYEAIQQRFTTVVKEVRGEITPSYSSLLDFRPTMDKLFTQVSQQTKIHFETDLPAFFKEKYSESHAKLNTFSQALRTLGERVIPAVRGRCGEGVDSVGEFVTKSYLIAHELPNAYSIEEQKKVGNQWLQFFHTCMKAGGISGDDLRAFNHSVRKLLDTHFTEIEGSTPSQLETRKLVPIQEGILCLLLLIQGVRNIESVKDFVENHGEMFISFLESLQVPEISEKLGKINRKFGKIKSAVGILTNALTQKGVAGALVKGLNGVTSQNFALKKGVGLAFDELTKEIRSKPAFNEAVEVLDTVVKPVFTFLVCGVHGKGTDAETALKEFENKLTLFFQNLYDFKEIFYVDFINVAQKDAAFINSIKKDPAFIALVQADKSLMKASDTHFIEALKLNGEFIAACKQKFKKFDAKMLSAPSSLAKILQNTVLLQKAQAIALELPHFLLNALHRPQIFEYMFGKATEKSDFNTLFAESLLGVRAEKMEAWSLMTKNEGRLKVFREISLEKAVQDPTKLQKILRMKIDSFLN